MSYLGSYKFDPNIQLKTRKSIIDHIDELYQALISNRRGPPVST